MKTKFQINERVITPDGPGVIQKTDYLFGEYKIRLESGDVIYYYEEDIEYPLESGDVIYYYEEDIEYPQKRGNHD